MKNSKTVSDWKSGLISNKYRENYDRIFKRIHVLADENIPQDEIHFYNLNTMVFKEDRNIFGYY